MSVIIDKKKYFTRGLSVSIPYDINQLDLSGARIQVKFDTKIVGGVGSKFTIRHSDSEHKQIGEHVSPIMESSTEGTSHVFIVYITNDILQKSKFLTVLTNGSLGTDKVELEVTNVEIKTLEHVQIDPSLFALKTYQMLKKGETSNTSNNGNKVLLIISEQAKPLVATEGEVLLEHDTGKVFYYDGAEWREFV